MPEKTYTLAPSRYAKNSITVRPLDSISGMKGKCSHILEAMNARWVHRERGYVMAASKRDPFEQFIAEGWDADLRFFHGQAPCFTDPKGNKYDSYPKAKNSLTKGKS